MFLLEQERSEIYVDQKTAVDNSVLKLNHPSSAGMTITFVHPIVHKLGEVRT